MNIRSAATVLSLLLAAGLLIAGPLTPPAGPVASTYKTLSEVEPRTPINATTTPGDANSVFRITAPGSYYLTANILGAAGKHGIEIATNNVTIDLQGFAVLGSVVSLNGINLDGAHDGITVRNGVVTGWGGGGVYLGGGRGHLVESIVANGNHDLGILAATAGIVRNCSASQNGTGFLGTGGIGAGDGGLVESCTADLNNGVGLAIGQGGTIRGSAATNNTAYGINGSYVCTVTGCTVAGNTRGIEVYFGSTVADCRVSSTTLAAIRAENGCDVRNNHCVNSTPSAGSCGVSIAGDGARVEGNICSGFEVGFQVSGVHNFFARNTARGNTTNWGIAATNACYVVSATMSPAVYGNNGGYSVGTTDPNANFSY